MGGFQVKLYREHQNFNYWVKNEQQRVPCNLLPWRKQVVPTALHSSSNTSPLKPPSCCGLEHSIPPSAMPGICLKGSSSLTTFLGHSSALALSALALPHKAKLPQGRDQQEKRRDLMLSQVGVTGPCQTGCLFQLGLAGGAWMLLYKLTSTSQISCIPEKARDSVWFCDAVCSSVQHTTGKKNSCSSGSSTSCCWQGCSRQCLAALGQLDTGNGAKLSLVTPLRSLDFSS